VVTTSFSFIASANAILHAGATPVFADMDSKTFNVDPKKIKPKIAKGTQALLPVHLYGYPCDMQEIMSIAEDNKLRVVEDACQAHGAEYKGRKVGSIGDAGCFSFYPSKNMTVCGDGGMIVTNDDDTARMAAKLRDCGRKTRYEHDVVGYTSRLNTVNAAIGRVQLRRLDEWNRKRVHNASIYDELLSGLDEIVLPPKGDSLVQPVYHLYVIRAKNRDRLKDWLEAAGIRCGVHYPLPIPLQPAYKQSFEFRGGEYPLGELASQTCLSLPMSPQLTKDSARYVCKKICEFYQK
jgi:dTDP-4-amino-4,6-dideoxygalactose transaminase